MEQMYNYKTSLEDLEKQYKGYVITLEGKKGLSGGQK